MTPSTDRQGENEFGRCYCDRLMGIPYEKLIIHLSGCPIGDEAEHLLYRAWPWYKKLWHGNPRGLYQNHLKSL